MARGKQEQQLSSRREKGGKKAGMLFARGVCHRGTLHYTIKGGPENRSDGRLEFYVPHLPRNSRGVRAGDLQVALHQGPELART